MAVNACNKKDQPLEDLSDLANLIDILNLNGDLPSNCIGASIMKLKKLQTKIWSQTISIDIMQHV